MRKPKTLELKRKNDRNHIIKNTIIKKTVAYLLTNKNIIRDVGSIINECLTYENFQNKIQEFYLENNKLITIHPIIINYLYKFYKQKKNLGDLRGGLLEILSLEIFKIRYKFSDNSLIELSCRIKMNKWISTYSVDICAWCCNNEIGECAECKVNVDNFEKKHCELMKEIKTKTKILPKCISFSSQITMESYIDSTFKRDEISHITFIGRDKIMNLLKLEAQT